MLRMVRESASVTKDSRTANSVDIEDESDHVQRSKSIARDNVVDILTGPEDDFISPSQSSGSPLSVLVPFKSEFYGSLTDFAAFMAALLGLACYAPCETSARKQLAPHPPLRNNLEGLW